MPDGERKPDALLIKIGWEPPVDVAGEDREHRVYRYANRTLGTLAYMSDTNFDGWKFFAPGPTGQHTFCFPKAHPRAGESRFDWEEHMPGCKFGLLKTDDSGYIGPPLTDAHISAARAERQETEQRGP